MHRVARFAYWGLLGAAFALTLAGRLWAHLDPRVPGMPGLNIVLTLLFYGLGLAWLPGVAFLSVFAPSGQSSLLPSGYVQTHQPSRLAWLARWRPSWASSGCLRR
ncbi:MAG: hypothetical protein C4301_08520 [Thermus sp.]|uniref:hypothetical protein n=1 Tax=Thermus sp. TaxID=275 RepID=UPI00332CA4C6